MFGVVKFHFGQTCHIRDQHFLRKFAHQRFEIIYDQTVPDVDSFMTYGGHFFNGQESAQRAA